MGEHTTGGAAETAPPVALLEGSRYDATTFSLMVVEWTNSQPLVCYSLSETGDIRQGPRVSPSAPVGFRRFVLLGLSVPHQSSLDIIT